MDYFFSSISNLLRFKEIGSSLFLMPRGRHSDKGVMKTWGASIDPELENELLAVTKQEKRSKAQIGGFLLARGLAAYKRDGQLFDIDEADQAEPIPTARIASPKPPPKPPAKYKQIEFYDGVRMTSEEHDAANAKIREGIDRQLLEEETEEVKGQKK